MKGYLGAGYVCRHTVLSNSTVNSDGWCLVCGKYPKLNGAMTMAAAKKSAKKSALKSLGRGVDFKALSRARKAKRGKEKAVQLPDGFRVVGRAPNHDFDKHPILEGERGPTKEVVLNAGTKTEKETRCFVVVSEELGAVNVWESAGLRDLFDDTEDGDYIRIEHTETLAPRKKGQQGMRVFKCAVRE